MVFVYRLLEVMALVGFTASSAPAPRKKASLRDREGTEGRLLAWQQAGGTRMRSKARIALGTEAGSDVRRIGRDPRKMGPDELRALGHAPMTPTAVIRYHAAAVRARRLHGEATTLRLKEYLRKLIAQCERLAGEAAKAS